MAINPYHNEWNRLQSYVNWPVTAEAYPSSLSRAGFYYTGDADIVRCFCCAVRLGHWLRTDLPLQEHTRHSPACRFVLGEETGNIPIPGSPSVREIRQRENSILEARGGQKKSDRSTSADSLVCAASGKSISTKSGPSISDGTTSYVLRLPVCGNVSDSSMSNSNENTDSVHCGPDLGTQVVEKFKEELQSQTVPSGVILYVSQFDILLLIGRAVKPQYASIVNRIETFKDWTHGHVQNPLRLSEAGFFFTGREDRVRCFHCNGGLCNWEADDVPLYEHARWFRHCAFIQKCRDHPEARAIIDSATSHQTPSENRSELVQADAKRETQTDSASLGQEAKKECKAGGVQDKEDTDLATLSKENERLRATRICKVCMTQTVGIMFLPCSHLVCCLQCALQVTTCPVCRTEIQATVKVFI